MAKQRSKTKDGAEEAEAAKPAATQRAKPSGDDGTWPRWARSLASLLIALHVAAIFVAPWANQTPPALPPDFAVRDARGIPRPNQPIGPEHLEPPRLIAALMRIFRPYLNLTYANHGYDFFSPDPAGSFLIGYDVLDKRGKAIASGEFPSRQRHWPRLLYHRYMMLAAQLPDLSPIWPELIGQELIERHDGARARIYLIYHRLPLTSEVLAGTVLDASQLYERVDEITVEPKPWARQELPRPDRPAVRIPGVEP